MSAARRAPGAAARIACPPAAVLAVAFAWAAVIAVPSPASAQVSPGPLSRAHAEWDRPAECFKCHARGGKGPQDQRCLECHGEIAQRLAERRGFHAQQGREECGTCHPEHGGRDFALIPWGPGDERAFDHADAGFELKGRHARVECRKCHQSKNQRAPVAAKIKLKDRGRSWLGLDTACASCHEDPHRTQLGADCASCHDENAWKPAPRFDHARTAYPLTGRHAQLECAKCHLAPAVATAKDAKGQPLAQWKPLPHADCAACHRDPHAGRFKGACATCHRTESFTQVDAKGFDHAQTRYPLKGKHAAVACARCHDPKTGWGAKPAFATCGSCHKDAHAGQVKLAGPAADCASCHGVEGFDRPRFTVAQHAQTGYPLEGRHANAACAGCHPRQPAAAAATLGPARVPLHPRHEVCTDCHLDPHGGRFAAGGARAKAQGCPACHGMEGFRPARYDAAAHATSAFALRGAHRAVPCVACHAELKAAPAASTLASASSAARPLRFAESGGRCDACHPGPHGDQFAARKDHGACEACHDEERFAPASRFDHSKSAFRLDGAHRRAACADCHPSVAGADGRPRVVYRPVPHRCEDCHHEGESPPAPKRTSLAPRPAPVLAAHLPTEVRHDRTVR